MPIACLRSLAHLHLHSLKANHRKSLHLIIGRRQSCKALALLVAPRPRAALHFFIGFSMLNQMLPRPTSSRQHYYRQPYPLKFQHFYNLSTHMLNSLNPRSGRSDATLQLEPLGCRLHKYVLHTSTHFYACVTSTVTFAPQQLSGPSLCLCSLLPLWPQ